MTFNKKYLSLTMTCLLGTTAFYSNAALVGLQVSANTTTTADSTTTNDSDGPSALVANAHSDAFGDIISSSNASASADNVGWFYLTSRGYYNFEAESIVTQSYTVTNDSINDQFFNFSFDVMNGGISSSCGADGYGYGYGYGDGYGSSTSCDSDDYAVAGYMAEILYNGNSIWDSSASIKVGSSGSELITAGSQFDTYQSANSLSWGRTHFNLNLGIVAANADFTLDYVVKTYVKGAVANPYSAYNTAYSQFGDPSGFDSSNITFSSRVTNVPEPSSIVLFGLALSGLALSRRSKRVH
jgi:hypothetical protein